MQLELSPSPSTGPCPTHPWALRLPGQCTVPKGSSYVEALAGVPPASHTAQGATLSPPLRQPEEFEEPGRENQISRGASIGW